MSEFDVPSGLPARIATPRRKVPVQIFGPGRRGELPKSHATQGGTPPQIINPDNPTPGTVDMTNMIYNAFATDLNDNILDSGMPPDRTVLAARPVRWGAEPGRAQGRVLRPPSSPAARSRTATGKPRR